MATVDTAEVLARLDKSLRPPTIVERQKLTAADRKTRDEVYRIDQILKPWAGYSPKDWRALDAWLDQRLGFRPVDAPARWL